MDYQEFTTLITKARTPKTMMVQNSWGVYDAYKLLRKNGWHNVGRPLKEHEFYSVIRKVNRLLADEIANGNKVSFPHAMGHLELRKFEVGVSIVNGKLKNTYPIDWSRTMRLWYEDEEARENKILLRKEDKFVYFIKYCKHNAHYKNQVFYQFALNRFLQRALGKNISKGKIDTLW